jgi:hypothetical protein
MQIRKRLIVLSAVCAFAYIATATQVRAGEVNLLWEDLNDPASVGGYILYYWQSTWDTVESVYVGSDTSYTLTGLEDGKTYHIVVTVYSPDEEEESEYSEEIVVTVSAD